MAGKFMKVRKVVIPALTLIALLAQSTPALAMTPAEATDFLGEGQTIVMELAEVDAITSAAPIYTADGQKVVYASNNIAEVTTVDKSIQAPAKVTDIKEFTDYKVDRGGGVIQGHWAEKSGDLQLLLMHNGINGSLDGDAGYKFEPNRSITTAELLSIILKTSGNSATDKAWPMGVMEAGVNLGIIPDSMINEGNTPILREKMAMVLVNSAKQIRNENTQGITFDASKISDLSQADSAYRQSIQTAYGMGLLAGTGTGYSPKEATTRAETCAIINRLFEYSNRVDTKVETPAPEGLSPAPDGSNVSEGGMVFPKEGDIINGVKVTRDPATGILGLGNGQHGGIYLGIKSPSNGYTIEVGSEATSSYDNMGGYYEQRGDYIFWTDEFSMIKKVSSKNVNSIPNPTNGMKADIFGNEIKSGSNETAFYLFNGDYWEYLW